jgi:hypothetical protein
MLIGVMASGPVLSDVAEETPDLPVRARAFVGAAR